MKTVGIYFFIQFRIERIFSNDLHGIMLAKQGCDRSTPGTYIRRYLRNWCTSVEKLIICFRHFFRSISVAISSFRGLVSFLTELPTNMSTVGPRACRNSTPRSNDPISRRSLQNPVKMMVK